MTISGKILRDAIISGANNIQNQRARVDELNQTIAEKQAILDAAPAETPAPEAPAEEEQPAE